MYKKRLLSLVMTFVLITGLMTGCGNSNSNNGENESAENGSISNGTDDSSSNNADPVKVDFSQTDADMFTNRDYETDYEEKESILIQLNGDSATASSDSVQISGTTITITEDATHIISGTLNDGMIIVNAPDTAKLQLVFNGVEINSETSAALYVLEADKVFVTLAEGTENSLSNGGTFEAIDENNIDAALFSKQDITFNGTGSLTVTSPVGHGIVAKDDLVITGGTYTVTSSSHGLDANDSVRITGETILTVDAGKDGIHAENTDDAEKGFVYISNGSIQIESEGDGISSGAYMQIENGTIDILAGGGSVNGTKSSSDGWGGFGGARPGGGNMSGDIASSTSTEDSESMKGLKAATGLLISNGTFTIDSADDSVHSNTSAIINNGTFEIASGDDAVHAEETLTITGGIIQITESYEGLEALDIDIQGGDIKLAASDDGLNAAGGTDASGTTGGRDAMFGGRGGGAPGGMSSSSNGSIVISGGNLYINASGDGIDANGSLTISGGYTTVVGPTQGDTATLDYDISAVITGGTFIGTGASGMAQTFSDSEQGVVAVSVGTQNAGTEIVLKDKDGNTLLTYTPELSFGVVILSSPDIISGETYTITVGSVSGEFEAS